MSVKLLYCDSFGCSHSGKVVYDKNGSAIELHGPFYWGDIKSGSPILCMFCGVEAEPQQDDEGALQ